MLHKVYYNRHPVALLRRSLSVKSMSKAPFNVAAMTRLVEHDNFDLREKLKTLFKEDLYRPKYSIPLHEERELAYKRLKKICESGIISVKDFDVSECVHVDLV